MSGWRVLALVMLAASSPAQGAAPAPDTILVNGRIYTVDPERPWAQALAIRNGVIVAVGGTDELAALRGSATKVVDLAGDTVLPGLHDVHVHPLFAGLREQECSIPQGSKLERIQDLIRACVAKAGKGAWIYGGQWDAPAIGQVPHRNMLDGVSRENPVLLYDTSGHSSLANGEALRLAGVTKDTPDPEGGIIERDATGNPTGLLREAAIDLVRSHLPPPTAEQVRDALKWSLDTMLAQGITSLTEASLGFAAGARPELDAYAALADAGVLKQRVRVCMHWSPGSKEAETVIAERNLYARDRVSLDCVKIFLDGVPTDSHTAAMLEPYAGTVAGRTDDASRTGMLLVSQEVLNDAVTRFDRMGLTVKFHAAGDRAVRAGLNAIGAARAANGYSGRLHDVGHCTFVDRSDLPKARAIAATFEVSPYLWSPSPINDSITAAVGGERIQRVWPVREMLEAGALVVPGSDWAVVPSVSPWNALEMLVTRKVPGGSGAATFGAQQAITLAQGIAMFTVNSARHRGIGDKVGRIDTGMLADLVVVDRNPIDIPITQVHEVVVQMTLIQGEVVYEATAAGK
jgi:hypothetical protein